MVWLAPVQAQTTFVQDTFTGTNGTLLSAHNPDIGDAASWVKISAGSDDFNIQGNQLENSTTKQLVTYKNTTAPTGGSAEYVVTVMVTFVGSAKATDQIGLIARVNGASNDRYEVIMTDNST